MHHNAPIGAVTFSEDIMGDYFDQMTLGMNWIRGKMENMIRHFNVT